MSKLTQKSSQNALPIKGDWSGVLDVGMAQLTLVLSVDQDVSSNLSATIDCLEQNITGFPVDVITFHNESLRFQINQLMAAYEGALNKERTEISGKFTQGGISFPLTLKQGRKSKSLWNRPQEPKPPYPYVEEEVFYPNSAVAGVTLAGTLTLPHGRGPFPVVLLITGSGPHDRDETLLGHKPFLVLADYLTRLGIAVLRVDDRGVGKSTGKFDTATDADFASDVLAGIEYLKMRRDVNREKIGLIGHSCGGIIAPMVAVKSKDVAFIVLMGAPGVTGEEVALEQAALIQQADGVSEQMIALDRKLRQEIYAILKAEPDYDAAEKRSHEVITRHLARVADYQRNRPVSEPSSMQVDNEETAKAALKFVNSLWYRHFLTFDPRSVLKRTTVPTLALTGTLDLQAPPKQNLPVIAQALKGAGNLDYAIVELPHLNHLFQSCQTGSPAEYAKIEETISPSALTVISDWILARIFS